MAENKINDIIASSLDRIHEVAEADTIVGTPINTNSGTVIIPISKVSFGFASGGAEYNGEKTAKDKADAVASVSSAKANANGTKVPCFGGGGGTGVSITPMCFLVVKASGDVDVLSVPTFNPASSSPAVGIIDSVSSFIEKSPDLISRFKDVFAKEKKTVKDLDDETLAEQIATDEEKELKK